ncbi:MAG: hypothetical protein RLN72_05660 [Henriciella sp.]
MSTHTPFLVAAAFATALMGHSGALPDFSGFDSDSEIRGSMTSVRAARAVAVSSGPALPVEADGLAETGLFASTFGA